MNAVADWLFTFLLGWTGNVFNGALRSLSSNAAGLSSFFAVIWLPLLLVLVAVGTAIDFIVWFVRWRPHYVWRSRAMRKLAEKQRAVAIPGQEAADMPEEYRGQIAQWVAEDEPPLPELWQNAPAEWEPTDEYVAQQPSDAAELYDPSVYMPSEFEPRETWNGYEQPSLSPVEDAAPYAENEALPFAQEDAQPIFTPEMQQLYDGAYTEPQVDETPTPAARRRRSGRHQTSAGKLHRATLGGLLHQLAPTDEEVLEGLPPPVSQEKAFRQPIYPDSYSYRQNDPPQ